MAWNIFWAWRRSYSEANVQLLPAATCTVRGTVKGEDCGPPLTPADQPASNYGNRVCSECLEVVVGKVWKYIGQMGQGHSVAVPGHCPAWVPERKWKYLNCHMHHSWFFCTLADACLWCKKSWTCTKFRCCPTGNGVLFAMQNPGCGSINFFFPTLPSLSPPQPLKQMIIAS